MIAYAGIFVAAIVEGEVAYIAAAALVAEGRLNPVAVMVAGALGAAVGDQMYFYAFRGRLPRWMARYPAIERSTAPLLARVERHASLVVLSIRFAPGLRIALAAACAWLRVSPVRFSALSLLSCFVWAAGLLVLVGWVGPTYLAPYGLGGWQGAAAVGLVLIGAFTLVGKYEARALRRASEEGDAAYGRHRPIRDEGRP